MSVGYDIVKFLENEGFGTEGIDIFDNFMPDSPDNLICIYDESAPTLDESACLAVDAFGIQIVVRNSTKLTAETISMNIHKKLVGFGGSKLVPGGENISYITVETPPNGGIGKDDNNRNNWSAHYNVRVESSGDEYRL